MPWDAVERCLSGILSTLMHQALKTSFNWKEDWSILDDDDDDSAGTAYEAELIFSWCHRSFNQRTGTGIQVYNNRVLFLDMKQRFWP